MTALAAAPSPSQAPFPNLRVLAADVATAAVPGITAALSLAPQLARLCLLIPGEDPRHVLPAFSLLAPTLRELRHEFDTDAPLRRDELLSLRMLSRLRELVLQPLRRQKFFFFVRAPELTDDDLVHLLAGLLMLRRFVFNVRGGWAVNEFAHYDDGLLQRIGHAAPLLEELALFGNYSVQALEPLAPTQAFPCLERLMVCRISLTPPDPPGDYEAENVGGGGNSDVEDYIEDLE